MIEERLAPPAPKHQPPTDRVAIAFGTMAALLVWVGIVAWSRATGMLLESQARPLVLFTPPILGGYREPFSTPWWLPAAVGTLGIVALPVAAARLRWIWCLVVAPLAAAAWWLAVALLDGVAGLTRGLEFDQEYRTAATSAGEDPVAYLRSYVPRLESQSIQIRGHPPGLALVLGALDRIGLGGPTWAAVTVVLVATSGVVAVLVATRAVAGEHAARRALPFLVLAPAGTWIVMSFDALYMGVAAWFVTLLTLAVHRDGRRADGLAVAAGAFAAVTVLLSYGLVLMGCVAVVLVVTTRRWRVAALSTATALTLIVALVPLGYWWFGGLLATRSSYYRFAETIDRPYGFFVFANLGAFALVLGPATFVALTRLRDRRLWVLVGGGLAAAAVADLSGLSNAETERIWLPFAIWILPAGAVLARSIWSTRGWLAVQVASVLVLTAFIQPYW